MNVSTIKLICWLAALASAGGLSKYSYDWFRTIEERQYPVDTAYVEKVLNADVEVETEVREIVDYEELKGTFLQMNWTGEPPKKPVQRRDPVRPTQPTYKPLSDVIAVFMIRYDTVDPGGSAASITYKKERLDATLHVGDKLMPPYDYAVVHAIKPRGIIFAFTDPERDNEELFPQALAESLIISVDADSLQVPKGDPMPKASPEDRGNAQTELIAANTYRLGYEDMETFAKDYQRILTEDVTTATYYKDGKRAGVEIKSVREGSIAARNGAMAGDVLISVNGHKVTSESEAIAFVKANQDKYTTWEVVVLRFGQEETLVYTSK